MELVRVVANSDGLFFVLKLNPKREIHRESNFTMRDGICTAVHDIHCSSIFSIKIHRIFSPLAAMDTIVQSLNLEGTDAARSRPDSNRNQTKSRPSASRPLVPRFTQILADSESAPTSAGLRPESGPIGRLWSRFGWTPTSARPRPSFGQIAAGGQTAKRQAHKDVDAHLRSRTKRRPT